MQRTFVGIGADGLDTRTQIGVEATLAACAVGVLGEGPQRFVTGAVAAAFVLLVGLHAATRRRGAAAVRAASVAEHSPRGLRGSGGLSTATIRAARSAVVDRCTSILLYHSAPAAVSLIGTLLGVAAPAVREAAR